MTNTSTTMMLLPIVTSVIASDRRHREGDRAKRSAGTSSLCLLLGTAFGATIGGVATLVGTPPNAFLAAFLADNYGIEISFARWMLVGLPVTVILLPIVLARADPARLSHLLPNLQGNPGVAA